jgi:fatty-acyl-CoA synthase
MNDHGIGSWTTRRARMLADKPALVEADRATTYGELDDCAVRVAHGLRSWGVGRGDRVAHLGLNSVDLVVSMFATAKLGAAFVPLNTRLAAPELAFVLADVEPRLLLWKADFAEQVSAPDITSLQIPSLRLPVGGEGLAALRSTETAPLDESIELDDLFMIQYTSGTSGRPKGVQLTHGNITWNVYNLLADVDVGTDEVALVTAPLFHTAALNQALLPTLLKGGTALIEARFDPERAVRLIEAQGVTLLFGVTSMYVALAGVPDFATADLTSLRSALTGGAPVPKSLLQTWADRGLPLIQGYGMTETAPGATMLRGEHALRRLGSAGAGVFFGDVRVVGVDGEPVAVDEAGEVQVSGPNVSPGYWRNPQATASAFTPDGWLRTGDTAVVDADGFLRIAGRLGDMFISGGENVYPAEVEQALYTHPAVAECAVIGVSDEKWGEVGMAIVVCRDGMVAAGDELREHLDGRLARYKIPKTVVFVSELPHNAAGKVMKSTLHAEYGTP